MKKVLYCISGAMLFAASAGFELKAQEPAVYTAPVKLEINSQEAFDQWTNINPTGDSAYDFVYSASEGGALVAENKSAPSNYWLVSPAVTVTAGSTYEITVYAKNASTYSTDKSAIALYAGDAATVDALTNQIFKNESLSSKFFTTTGNTGKFTATADGQVYFGIHVITATYKGGTAIQYLDIAKAKVLPGTPTGLQITAGEKGTMTASLTWKQPEVNQYGAPLGSLNGAYIYRGTSSYFTPGDANKVGTIEAATPGQEVTWTDESVPSSGKYYYRVAAYNEDGAGSACSGVQSPYIGLASSVPAVTDVVATPVADSSTSVSLTFTQPAPTEGYFDPADVAYKITRTANGSSTQELETAWKGTLPYIDNTITELGSYVYNVYTVFNGSTSFSAAKSNAVVTGGCASLPYSQDFSSSNAKDLYTFFHGPDGTKDWGVSSNALDYWGGPTADAYALTPKFNLEKGKAYELSFSSKVSRATSPKNLEVKIGTEPTAEGLTEQIWEQTITSTYAQTTKQVFSVPESGEYYIAFHCYGASDFYDLYVDDIKLDEILATPKAVTDLEATPAAEGALKVTLSWTNPTETTAGETLDIVEKIEVRRGSDIVATLENLPGGENSTFEDEVEAAGIYTYSLTPYIGETAGDASSVTTAWVGMDTPKAPENVIAKASENGVEITFDAVTEGINGGYVDPDKILYIIKRNDETLTEDCESSPYVDDSKELPLAMYTYSVAATDGENTSAFTAAPAIKLGEAIELPFTPDLADASTRDLFTSSILSNGNNAWTYNSSKGAMASDGGTLITPPLMMEAGKISVKWKATCYNARYTEDFEILLCKNDDPDNLDVIATIATPHVESVSWPSEESAEIEIPTPGRYYIAYRIEKANWTLYIYQADVIQTLATTGMNDIEGGKNGIIFDATASQIILPDAGYVTIHNIAGKAIFNAAVSTNIISTANISAGIYVITWTAENGEKVTAKIRI